MSVTTTYKCDKCEEEQNIPDQFWTVGVVVSERRSVVGTNKPPVYKMEVCRKCLESFGIYVQKEECHEQQPKPPTIEELITEIVQYEMQNSDKG